MHTHSFKTRTLQFLFGLLGGAVTLHFLEVFGKLSSEPGVR